MKFLVFSDSHRRTNGIDQAIERHKEITHIIFCGDIESDYEYMDMVYGRTHSICAVCGNNDYFASTPLNRMIKCEGHLIYVTHGHKERVKSSLFELYHTAIAVNADFCIYGHTHVQNFEECCGIKLLNPGSIGYPKEEYAIIDVTKDYIKVELYRL